MVATIAFTVTQTDTSVGAKPPREMLAWLKAKGGDIPLVTALTDGVTLRPCDAEPATGGQRSPTWSWPPATSTKPPSPPGCAAICGRADEPL